MMKAFFSALLLASILAYCVNANCKYYSSGKVFPEGCQRCASNKRAFFTCQDDGVWDLESENAFCERGEHPTFCQQKEVCKAGCVPEGEKEV